MKYIQVCLFLLLSYFGNGQTYFLNGNAQALGGDCYQLTTTLGTQNGTVWYGEQIDLEQPFDLAFTMNFGNLDDNGADGMCFVLQTFCTAACGDSGGGMGYLNFGTSLGVEFDTYQNGGYGDPFYDHIGIEINGDIDHNSLNNIAGPIQADPFDFNIEDGEDHVVRITWNPDSTLVKVFFDCAFRISGTVDLINTVFGGNNLVYWGFTAATGGLYNNQTVCLQENIVTSSSEVSVCDGGSVELTAGSSIDGVYTWTPTDYLSATDQASVLASPPSTTTYQVQFTDLCGDLNTIEITVVVETLEVSIGNIAEVTCLDPLSTITADINLPGAASWEWIFNGQTVQEGAFATWSAESAGQGSVIATYQLSCFDTLDFEVFEDLATFTANAGPDMEINCNQQEVTLTGSSNNPSAIMGWTQNGAPISTTNVVTVDEPGNYVLVVFNPDNGCTTLDQTFVLADFAVPAIDYPLQDTLSCLNPVVTIDGLNTNVENYSVSWETSDGVIVSGSNTSSPSVNAPGVYIATIINEDNGCTNAAIVEIEEDDELNFNLNLLTFPNIFSPNGDKDNQIWRPFLMDDPDRDIAFIFETFEIHIYNRWGNPVFEATSANTSWNASDLSEGVYFYHVRYKAFCSEKGEQEVEGTIQLMR